MIKQPNAEDYLWVVLEYPQGQDEQFVGLAGEDGLAFIPATADKPQAEALMGRLPNPDALKRQVEAIHRHELLTQAAQAGYQVFLVDHQGRVCERLAPPSH